MASGLHGKKFVMIYRLDRTGEKVMSSVKAEHRVITERESIQSIFQDGH